MGFVVKNTTKFNLLDLVCPHTCCSCGGLGAVLCERCKNDIIQAQMHFCPICKKLVAENPEKVIKMTNGQKNIKNSLKTKHSVNSGVGSANSMFKHELSKRAKYTCLECEMPFTGLWALGWRTGALEKLVEEYKYQSVRAMRPILAEFLDLAILVDFGKDEKVIIIPLPTIGRHIRERGLDHTLCLAKSLSRLRGWRYECLLERAVDTVQVGTKAANRKAQAEQAYTVRGKIDPSVHYLLLDDVWTTGATMLAAAKTLQQAGAKQISGVVVAVSKFQQ